MKPVHLKAAVIYMLYSVGMKVAFVNSLLWQNQLLAYALLSFASAVFGVAFLYLFSHKDFFAFAKDLEHKGIKKERWWLFHLAPTGKIVTVIIIGTLSGSLLASLSIRTLFGRSIYKYFLVICICIFSSLFWLTLARQPFYFLKLTF